MTVQLGDNSVQCTPAVRMVLEKPIILGSLKSNILFPAEVQIMHQGVRMPIRIGAVIAPVTPETYVSQDTPVAIKIVYAIPTKPIKITITIEQDVPVTATPSQVPSVDQRFPDLPNEDKKHQFSGKPPQNLSAVEQLLPGGSVPPAAEGILQGPGRVIIIDNFPIHYCFVFLGFGALSNKPDYVNNADAVVVPNQEAVVVESQEDLPPKNVTVIEFPQQEAEPHLEVDEEDAELGM